MHVNERSVKSTVKGHKEMPFKIKLLIWVPKWNLDACV